MKNSGVCPKCGSGDVVKTECGRINVPVGVMSAPVERWVCCSCGYSEEWVRKDYLKKVKKWWQ